MSLDKSTLIALATTHPQLSVRRSAAHALFSLGCITGAVTTAGHAAAERAAELKANAVATGAIEKAQGAQS